MNDWKGNEIKSGDTVCIIRVRTGQHLQFTGIILLDDNTQKLINWVPQEEDKECWEVVDEFTVEGPYLKYSKKYGECTVTSSLIFDMDDKNPRFIIAIKGISDEQPRTDSPGIHPEAGSSGLE